MLCWWLDTRRPALLLASLLILCTALAFAPGIDTAGAAMSTDVTFYVKADGSVYPQPAPISTSDNSTYTFFAGWTYLGGDSALVVERDNIVIDGAEFMLRGKAPNSNGITLVGRSNVTLTNMVITEFSRGIWLSGSSNNTIMGSDIASNLYGVELDRSSRNAICQNNIVGSSMPGIWLHGESASNNSMVENNITSNYYGVRITEFSGNNSMVRNNITNNYDGIVLSSSSNNSVVGNTFVNDGLLVFGSFENAVSGNVVNGKPLVYLESETDYNVSDCGQIVLVNCDNIRVESLNLSHTTVGLELWGTNNSKILGNVIADNSYGITFWHSSNNSVLKNSITSNNYGFLLTESSSNFLCENIVADNYNPGIVFTSFSDNNTIVGNNLTANAGYGLMLYESSNNLFYHNNVRGNGKTVYIGASGYANFWNSSIEGNYWSDYTGSDFTSDGLGEIPYVADANNTDYHPLMGVFSEFSATSEHHVQIVSNSSIFGFHFTGTDICFNVTAEDGTSGFCRICIPTALMSDSFKVFVNGTEAAVSLLPCSNSTHTYLYFNYTHSTQEVIITPESVSLLALPFFVMSTLLVASVYRKRHKTSYSK